MQAMTSILKYADMNSIWKLQMSGTETMLKTDFTWTTSHNAAGPTPKSIMRI